MKNRIFLFFLITISATVARAQIIDSIKIEPIAPLSDDTIRFYISMSFPSGSCDQHQQNIYVNGNTIYADAIHCLGMLTYICSHTDTFILSPLPAASYQLIFHVDAGLLPQPCTPGINPGPTDTMSFTVAPVINSAEVLGNRFCTSVFPNPCNGKFYLTEQTNDLKRLEVYDVSGKKLASVIPDAASRMVDLSFLANGIYYLAPASRHKGQPYIYKLVIARE